MSENIQRSAPRRAAASAFAALPPDLQKVIAANRIEAVRVEESGALCLRMANQAGLSEKSCRIEAVRATARTYGLDLQRLAFAQSLDSRFDDGTLLVCERGPGGNRPRLFRADGSVDPQARGASTERQSAADRARPVRDERVERGAPVRPARTMRQR